MASVAAWPSPAGSARLRIDALAAGLERAAAAVDDGRARARLDHWVQTSQSLRD